MQKTDFYERIHVMKFAQARPFVRFADSVSYSIVRLPSVTYDARLLYLTDGACDFSVGGASPKRLGKGALVFFRPHTEYTIRPHPAFSALAVDFDFTEEFSAHEAVMPPISLELFEPVLEHTAPVFSDAQILNSPVILEDAYDLYDALSDLANEFRRGEMFYRERCSALLISVLAEIARRGISSEGRVETFRRVVGYIQNHSLESLGNNDIARALGFDPCYLNRVVRFFTGLSLHQYVIKYRIDKALALLLSTDMSIEEVALYCGFYSSAHFSNQCKKQTGKRPSFYKNKTKN